MSTFAVVRACAEALLAGVILHASNVSAGSGKVIDWRVELCGETIQEGGDAFDTAQLFVALVGVDAASGSLHVDGNGAIDTTPVAPVIPAIAEFMRNANGGRRRSFTVDGFTVFVEPHENDDAQAAFIKRLSVLAVQS